MTTFDDTVRTGLDAVAVEAFREEAADLVARLADHVARLEGWVGELADDDMGRADDALLAEAFRAAHSLHGLASAVGAPSIQGLASQVTRAFDAARRHELPVDEGFMNLAVDACRQLGEMIAAGNMGGDDAAAAAEAMTRLAAHLAAFGLASGAASEELLVGGGDEVAAISLEQIAAECDEAFAGIVDEQSPAKYLAIFIDEADLSLDSMTEVLLGDIGQDPRQATETLLITSHRIKGSAASIGLNRLAKLAHLMEDLLQDYRESGKWLSAELTDAMLRCTDAFRTFVQELRSGTTHTEHFPVLAAELLAARRSAEQGTLGIAAGPTASSTNVGAAGTTAAAAHHSIATSPDFSSAQLDAIRVRAPQAIPAWAGIVRFEPNLILSGMKARLLYEKMAIEGKVFYCEPEAESLDDIDGLAAWTFAVATSSSAEELRRALLVAGVAQVDLQPIARAPSARSDMAKLTPASHGPASNEPPFASTFAPPAECTLSTAPVAATVRPLAAPAAAESCPATPAATQSGASSAKANLPDTGKPVETLRVDIERLDHLMNLAGQLVINKARFARIGDGLRQAVPGKQAVLAVGNACNLLKRLLADNGDVAGSGGSNAYTNSPEWQAIRQQLRRAQADLEAVQTDLQKLNAVRASVNDLGEAVHQLDRVSDGIQKSVMDTRMVPIGPLFTRFRRVIRDITRGNGKQIELAIRGEKTELDKRMIDELGDPLIHMVRNSADHGVESPEARVAAGKPAQGTITLEAFHRGNSIVILVTDDGRGLDPARIRAKAVEKGIVSQADADGLPDDQAFQLIWEAGFSTAERVTEISGRGMGMDIVRSKIEELNGTVEVSSRLGEGTTFTIKLPLTLAILPSLLSTIDGDVFAVPLDAVVEIVKVGAEDLKTVQGRLTARVRERVVSVVRLEEMFDWRTAARVERDGSNGAPTLVILGVEGREIGVVVDRLLGEEDIVIKSLAENFRNVAGVAGASILGDGSVALILDPSMLLEMASRQTVTPRS